MIESKKHVFWQAFVLTVIFFILGLVFGVYIEQTRSDDFSTSFYQSEVSLYDSLALSNLLQDSSISCSELKNSTISFADKIYFEAKDLEGLDEKSQVTNSLKVIHRKYDLLRTLLWMNIIQIKERCPKATSFNSVVYLYNYTSEDIQVKSEQAVWEKFLNDLKQEQGDNIVLVPIAADSDLSSLNYFIEKYNISSIPAVIVNEKNITYDVEDAESIKNYLH